MNRFMLCEHKTYADFAKEKTKIEFKMGKRKEMKEEMFRERQNKTENDDQEVQTPPSTNSSTTNPSALSSSAKSSFSLIRSVGL